MSIPILKDDRGDAIWTISERAVDRYNNHYVYHNYAVDYWLGLALPHYVCLAPSWRGAPAQRPEQHHGCVSRGSDVARHALGEAIIFYSGPLHARRQVFSI